MDNPRIILPSTWMVLQLPSCSLSLGIRCIELALFAGPLTSLSSGQVLVLNTSAPVLLYGSALD